MATLAGRATKDTSNESNTTERARPEILGSSTAFLLAALSRSVTSPRANSIDAQVPLSTEKICNGQAHNRLTGILVIKSLATFGPPCPICFSLIAWGIVRRDLLFVAARAGFFGLGSDAAILVLRPAD